MSFIRDTIMIDSSDEAADKDELKPKTRVPIVYTTKLNDMKIFKEDISRMYTGTVINSIIKESKPKVSSKRKYAETTHFPCSKEHLSCYINNFNRKVARITENRQKLLSVCKPVKVVLVDIKYTLLRKQTPENNLKTVSTKSTAGISRKLKTTLIYDQQNKEADMYSLDTNLVVKGHITFQIDSDDDILRQLKLNKNVPKVSCCCWYGREEYLACNMLGFIPHNTLKFMRKPHKCEVNHCRCCCRKHSINVSNATADVRLSLLKSSESPSIWLNNVTNLNASLSNKSNDSLRSKLLSFAPNLPEKTYRAKPTPEDEMSYFLHSTGIDFGEEYYAIGADGKIKLSLKDSGKDSQHLINLKSQMTNNIVGNICCWYKREEFADRLLVLGALRNTVNYIRTTHTCPTTKCVCCCKPFNTKKLQLARIHKLARHTSDLVRKKINIKVKFSGVLEEPVEPMIAKTAKKVTSRSNYKFFSFNFSLAALETISKSKVSKDVKCDDVYNSLIPEAATLDQNNRSVRVRIEKNTRRENVVVECKNPITDFTTYELTMLDIFFRAFNNNTEQIIAKQKNKIASNKNRIRQPFGQACNPIYPLLLNTQLSVTSDLKNKRFLPPLRAHLEKYNLNEMLSNISSWIAEEKYKGGLRKVKKVKQTKDNVKK
ncbi:hypothetical protein PYW08_009264 [Mythimna loreyi]|uniref:Uncharacterized protein n=1 Tax=Mythimna loreyi TaxID=667449 RepID=A0ACC2Q877_9NEOP|nr:hypothetical protein PYW08_009264 [Mythimna loreyi]